MNSSTRRDFNTLAFSFVLLMLILSVSFFRNTQLLFNAHDGQFFLHTFSNYAKWASGALVGSYNPLQGATGFFSFDGFLIPGIYPFFLDIPLRAQMILCYLAFAAEMYLAIYLLTRTLGASPLAAAATGWFSVLMLFPSILFVYPLAYIFLWSPLRAHSLALGLLAITALLHVHGLRRRNSLGSAAAFVFLILLLVNTGYMVATAMFPMLAVGILFVLASSEDKSAFLARCAVSGIAAGALFLTGTVRWVTGQLLYAARFSLNAEFIDAFPSSFYASTIFGMSRFSLFIIPLAVLGCVFLIRKRERILQSAGWYCLLMMSSVAVMAVAYMLQWYDARRFLRPVYIEYSVLAIYPMAGAYALAQLASLVLKRLSIRLPERLSFYALLLAAAYFAAYLSFTLWGLRNPDNFRFPVVQETTLTKRLKAEIAIAPGSPFRGRCVSFLWSGAYSDEELFSGAKPRFDPARLGGIPGINNIHLQSDLWAFDIPTIEGYDQATTLPYYLTFSRTASAAPWVINHTSISRFNIPLFRASGIRFAITDRQVDVPGLTLAAYALFSKDTLLAEAGSRPDEYPAPPPHDAAGLFLYEISGVNLATYAPARVTQVGSLPLALERICSPSFDYSQEVLVFETDLPQATLAPLTDSMVEMRRGGIRLEASSPGASIILLPFQYSKTIRWESDQGTAAPLRIVRADIFLTAVYFEKKVAGTLWLDAGFGLSRARRLDDYLDMRRLKIQDVPQRALTGDARWYKPK